MEWQLQDAKNQFSKVVQKARHEGPQIVTLRGERTAVVLSAQDYDTLRAGRPTLVDDLLGGLPGTTRSPIRSKCAPRPPAAT